MLLFKTTKDDIIKWLLRADQFSFMNTCKNKQEYKSSGLELKVDKSILNKERYYISGHDAIFFHDKPKSSRLILDF